MTDLNGVRTYDNTVAMTPLRFATWQGDELIWPPYTVGGQKKVTRQHAQLMRDVMWTLHHQGGTIFDASGRATHTLIDRMPARSVNVGRGAISSLLQEMQERGLITRNIVGRRTYSIDLLLDVSILPAPDPFPHEEPTLQDPTEYQLDAGAADDLISEAGEIPVYPPDAADLTPDMNWELEPVPQHDLNDYTPNAHQVAIALLDAVLARITADARPDDPDVLAERGAAAELAVENDVLREEIAIKADRITYLEAELRDTQVDLDARTARMRGLETTVHTLELNVETLGKQLARYTASEEEQEKRHRQLDKFIRSTPTGGTP